ncbi:hypothetical protein KDA06_02995 [Candidatus Saccharibacteria bacterium]|nr:hypothetical protein [Candidatus Saccharibacteria bacterium]HPR09290.1 pilin [Candidatus Saccharibacteria bacterium]
MKRSIMAVVTGVLFSLSVITGYTSVAYAAVDPKSEACQALGAGADCGTDPSANGVNKTITLFINIFTGIIGITAVIMILVAGFKYITSGGESAKMASAKNTLIYALIGLVIVAFSQIIVKFVLAKSSGTPTSSQTTTKQQTP